MNKFSWMFVFIGLCLVGGLVGGLSPAAAETDTACTRTGGAINVVVENTEFVTDKSGNTGDSCKEVPDNYKVTFYRFGLCTQDPVANGNSLASCILLLNDDAGVEHVIQGTGTSAELDTSSAGQIIPGNYAYMVMMLKNELSIKHTETFSVSSGLGLLGKTGQGTTCWTTDSVTSFSDMRSGIVSIDPSTRSSLAMDCGTAAEANPQYTTEVFDSLGEDSITFVPSLGSEPVVLLQNDNVTTATTADNGARLLVSLPMNVRVTANSSFDLKFTLTDSVSIDMTKTGGDIYAIKNGADPFQVTLTVNN